MPKQKSTARDDRARARRSRLSDPVEVRREDSKEELNEESSSESPPHMPPPPNAYTFKLDHFTADCYVDTVVMLANEASIVRGSFLDAQGTDVRVDVPTTSFFELHALEPSARHTWSSLNWKGFLHCQLGVRICKDHGSYSVRCRTTMSSQCRIFMGTHGIVG